MSLNKVQLIGRVGKDPECRHLDGGQVVASFSVATSENYINKAGEKVEQTEWHNVVAWGKLAEIIEKWVSKGMLIYIEGKIRTRMWEKDGVKHYNTEILADKMDMLSKAEPKAENASQVQNSQSENSLSPQEEDLPF